MIGKYIWLTLCGRNIIRYKLILLRKMENNTYTLELTVNDDTACIYRFTLTPSMDNKETFIKMLNIYFEDIERAVDYGPEDQPASERLKKLVKNVNQFKKLDDRT